MMQAPEPATGPAVTLHHSGTLFATEYAYAATVAPGSRLIFLAGSCPLDAAGTTVGVGDYAAQAVQCLENLKSVLHDAGAGLADVVATRILVASTDRADLGVVWSVVRQAFGDHGVPSTLVGVTVLGYADQLVEIEAAAAVLDRA